MEAIIAEETLAWFRNLSKVMSIYRMKFRIRINKMLPHAEMLTAHENVREMELCSGKHQKRYSIGEKRGRSSEEHREIDQDRRGSRGEERNDVYERKVWEDVDPHPFLLLGRTYCG
jgi:hypothetical protein